jgi:hypothetical protein
MVTTGASRNRAKANEARNPHGGYRILERDTERERTREVEEPGFKSARPPTPGNRCGTDKLRS